MLLKDLETGELDSLDKAVGNEQLKKLLAARIQMIKDMEWGKEVITGEAKVRLAYAKGIATGYDAVLCMPDMIKEERELRDAEKEKEALAKKTKK